MGLERGGLPREGGAPGDGDAVEVGAQAGREVRVGAQVLDLPVDTRAAVLGRGLGLGAARRDVGGDLVALVGEGVRQGEGVLGTGGQRHQVLGVVDVLGDCLLYTWVGRCPRGSARRSPWGPSACLCAEAASSAPVLAILNSSSQGTGWRPVISVPGGAYTRFVRFPTLPAPVGSGRASPDPPPEGVNIGGELTGKFLWRVRDPPAARRLDARRRLWQYSPPRLPGATHSRPKQAPDLRGRANSAPLASLWRTL